MMRTLINESDATMTHVKEGKIKEYAASVKEVRTVSSYIQEQTMTLLDDELSEYQYSINLCKKTPNLCTLYLMFVYAIHWGRIMDGVYDCWRDIKADRPSVSKRKGSIRREF